jgi:hypothetical protein
MKMPLTLDETSYTFEVPNIDAVPEDKRDALLDDIGEYLLDSILDYVGDSKSPVDGGKFKKKLSEAYAKKEGKSDANLDLNGDMLDSLQFFTDVDNGAITIGIFNEDQVPKSYNHNVGDTLPQRQFIPDDDQEFKKEILRGVDRIVEEYLEE